MALIHLSRSSNRCRCSAWIPILLPQHHCSPQAASRSTLDKKLLYPNNEFSTKFQFYQTYLIHQIGSEAASLSSLWRWSIFSLLFMFFYHFFHFPLKFWFSRLLLFTPFWFDLENRISSQSSEIIRRSSKLLKSFFQEENQKPIQKILHFQKR